MTRLPGLKAPEYARTHTHIHPGWFLRRGRFMERGVFMVVRSFFLLLLFRSCGVDKQVSATAAATNVSDTFRSKRIKRNRIYDTRFFNGSAYESRIAIYTRPPPRRRWDDRRVWGKYTRIWRVWYIAHASSGNDLRLCWNPMTNSRRRDLKGFYFYSFTAVPSYTSQVYISEISRRCRKKDGEKVGCNVKILKLLLETNASHIDILLCTVFKPIGSKHFYNTMTRRYMT